MKRVSLLAVVALALIGARLRGTTGPFDGVWRHLDRTTNTCAEHYDYHPQGGMLIFWCHVRPHVDLVEVELLAGVPIWLTGPHSPETGLVWVPGTFGRYNPAFVRWLVGHAIPGDDDFRDETQDHYDRFVRPLARTHHAVLAKLRAHPGCASREELEYTKVIAAGASDTSGGWGPHYERWYDFLDPGFCGAKDKRVAEGDYNGNVVKTAVGFWLRRSMDGTDREWERGLIKLLDAYDSKWRIQARRSR